MERVSELDVSVVVPVHNEADNIRPLIDEIRAALDGRFDYELIYVDDGSTDGTSRILAELRAGFAGLRVLTHRQCCGQSTAIRTGVRAAGAPWVVTLDGDGQNDPADIRGILALALADDRPDDLQLIGGQRSKRHDNWLRRLSSRVANGVRSRLLRDHTPDTGCGLKAFRREAFLELPYFDHMHRFLAALFLRNGGRVVSVPVSHRPRIRGRSKYGLHNRLWVGLIDLLGVMWLQRRVKLPQVVESV